MYKAIITLICVGLFFVSASTAFAQKRKAPKAATIPDVICKDKALPAGYVATSEVPSSKCEGLAWKIEKASDTATICEGSTIPDGYRVVEMVTSPTCKGSNPLSNALLIAKDGVEVERSKPQPSASTSRRRSSEPSDAEQVRDQRADEVNAEARERLADLRTEQERSRAVDFAIKRGIVLVGMTQAEVVRSWGRPYDVRSSATGSGLSVDWFYKRRGDLVLVSFDKKGIADYVGN